MEDVKTENVDKAEEKPDPLKVPVPSLQVPVPTTTPKPEPTAEEKMVKAIKPYPFLKFSSGILSVKHDEYEALLKPKILKMGDLVQRGNMISNLNGGVANPDGQTVTLNSCIATVQVGFENLALDLLKVTDDDLVIGLYQAVVGYNTFFRKTPLNFVL